MVTTQLEAGARDASMTQLVTGIIHDTEELVTQQLQLVKVEVKNDVKGYIHAAIPMALGAFVALLGIIVLAFAAVHVVLAIWPQLPVWAGYTIVGSSLALIGTLLVVVFAKQFNQVKLLDQTAAGVKENIQWKTNS